MASNVNALIAGGIQPPQVPDMTTASAQAFAAANGRQQAIAGQLENQQRSLALQDQQVMRQAWGQAGGDLDKFQQLIAGRVSPTTALSVADTILKHRETQATISKSQADTLKAQADAAKTNADAQEKALGAVYDTTTALTNLPPEQRAAAWGPARQKLIDAGHIPPTDAPETYPGDGWLAIHNSLAQTAAQKLATEKAAREAQLAGPQLDEATAKSQSAQLTTAAQTAPNTNQDDWSKWFKQQPKFVQDQVGGLYSPTAYSRLQTMAVSPDEKFKVKAPVGEFERDYLPSYAQKLGKSVDQLSADERIQALGQFKVESADPEARAALLASRNLADAMRQIQLNQMPTPEQAANVAADVVNHRIAPDQFSQLLGRDQSGNFRRMIYDAAKRLDPDFNFEQAASEYQLARSPGFQNTVRYMDSVQQSMPRLLKSAQTLANGQIASINSLVNAGKRQFQDVDLAKFNTDRLLESDEIAKILAGGGSGAATSDAKLAQAQSILKESDNPAVIAGVLGEVNALIGYRRTALTRGTYLEHVQDVPAATPGGHNVGDVVKLKDGTSKKITKIYDDGSFDLTEVAK